LQKTSQVDGKVAPVSAEGFFGATSAETRGLQPLHKAFAEVDSKAIEFAAHRSLMYPQKLGNLTKRALVEKVGGQQETVFWREGLKRILDRDLELLCYDG
jgi:hypothetical protein